MGRLTSRCTRRPRQTRPQVICGSLPGLGIAEASRAPSPFIAARLQLPRRLLMTLQVLKILRHDEHAAEHMRRDRIHRFRKARNANIVLARLQFTVEETS